MDLLIRHLPEDVRRVIIREQAKEKEKRGTLKWSISSTIFKIIREWERCREKQ